MYAIRSYYANAGAFLSIGDVDVEHLVEAVERVIDAYGAAVSACDEVLIQPMLRNVRRSGVAFSHDPNTCAPYRVINWQDSYNFV